MTVPIVPGPDEPRPTSPPPAPQPVYIVQPKPDRIVSNTFIVLAILFGLFVVLPLLACVTVCLLGQLGG